MAKQSGLHQIKGKIGEYSYYKQTGVSGGLIRGINQGMSERVKNDAAYANTRLNNQEFGAAANTAALLGQTVTPKFRPMILPFSQSKMAKEILKVAREHTANWGQRVVTSDDTARLCDILTAMSKRSASGDVSLSFAASGTPGEITLNASISTSQATAFAGLGITGIVVTGAQYNIATGQWVPAAQQIVTGYVERKESADLVLDVESGSASEDSGDINVAQFVPAPNHSGHQIIVFVVLPTRLVNGVTHILQEYCSFVAMPYTAGA